MKARDVYFDAEVEPIIGAIMAKLPVGSSVSWRILNSGRTVTVEVRLPDGGKTKVFEFGLIEFGGTVKGRSRIGRQGDALSKATAKSIIKWSKE